MNNTDRPTDSRSLVVLASQNRLPEFQYMDAETCAWIASQNPSYTPTSNFHCACNYAPWLHAITIPNEWFLEKRLIDTLHGQRHLWRTAYFCLWIAQEHDLHAILRNCVLAGLLHDIRRKNDKNDSGHAERSSTWFETHCAAITAHWGIQLNAADIAAISTAIALHETPYQEFSTKQQALYAQYSDIVDVLKTADALDRYRLPKLIWWPRDEYIRILPSEALKQQAYSLVLRSEKIFLAEGLPSSTSVEKAVELLSNHHRPIMSSLWARAHLQYETQKTSWYA